MKRRLPLFSATSAQVGFVSVGAQTVVDLSEGIRISSNPQSPSDPEENLVIHHRRTQSLPPKLLTDLRRPSQGWISIYFVRPITRTYRFHSGLGGDIGL